MNNIAKQCLSIFKDWTNSQMKCTIASFLVNLVPQFDRFDHVRAFDQLWEIFVFSFFCCDIIEKPQPLKLLPQTPSNIYVSANQPSFVTDLTAICKLYLGQIPAYFQNCFIKVKLQKLLLHNHLSAHSESLIYETAFNLQQEGWWQI